MTIREEIYDHIDSHSIREHCRDSRHHFSLLECAGIVFWSTCYNLREKQEAYRKLLTLCEDKGEWGVMREADADSLQSHLRRLIEEADAAYRFIERKPEPGVLFGFAKSKRYEYNNEVFSSVQKALDYMLQYRKDGLWNEICVIRPDAPEHPAQSLCFSPYGVLYEVDGFTPPGFGEEDESWPEDAYIGYPLPFENGDLLVIEDKRQTGFGVFSKPSPEEERAYLERWKDCGSTAELGRYYKVRKYKWDTQPRGGMYDIMLDTICVYNAPKFRVANSLIWGDKVEEAGFLQSLSLLMKQMPYDTPLVYGFLKDYLAFWNCRSSKGPAELLYGHDERL